MSSGSEMLDKLLTEINFSQETKSDSVAPIESKKKAKKTKVAIEEVSVAENVKPVVQTINLDVPAPTPAAEPVPAPKKSEVQTIVLDDDEHPTPVKGKLCLNMIVKNESKIIERLLGSVLSIVDTYCISDTGSTDNTVQLIREFMKKAGKPGVVFTEPFKNFGYNRTVALERAADWGEYALLLDADMRLVIKPEFNKDELTENGYCIIQKGGGLEYYNLRIVKTGVGVKCVCPTHEYYDFPNGGGNAKLSSLYIDDIGDGGCKSDKFERDIRLLKAGLEEEPRNERYHFYLANSYRDLGKHQEAIEWYKKRVELGGWIEEVFYSCYEIGHQYRKLNDNANAIFWWLEAYNRHPKRSESIYEIAKYYRENGKNHSGQIFCSVGCKIPYPKDDLLFIRGDVYRYLLDYEQSILAYYTGEKIDHYRYINLIGADYNKGNVLSNYKFYVKKLKDFCSADIDFCGKADKSIGGVNDSYTSSSPCIIPNGDGYLMNVRYVNYFIRPDGSYAFKLDDGKIRTLNMSYFLNRDFKTVKTYWIDEIENEHLRYQGVEDVKIFNHLGETLFLGTVENPYNNRIAVGHGTYKIGQKKLESRPFVSPYDRGCEKNWAYFHNYDGELRVVYDWRPLTIGEPDGDNLKIHSKDDDVPEFFRDLRGSSNGHLVGDEVWFLCHLVEYTTPRHYYHCLVVLDAHTMKYKKHSILFKFHGDCIEYSLGLVVESERVIMSYSKMDRTSGVMVVPRDVVDRELFPSSPAAPTMK